MVDAGDHDSAFAHRWPETAQPAQVGDVQHGDDVGAAKLLDGIVTAVHPRQIGEQKVVALRRGRRVGDCHIAPPSPQQVGEPNLASQSVAIGIHVSDEADTLAGLERIGDGPRRRKAFGLEGVSHVAER